MAKFELEIDGLLDREGGYVNDKDDNGGETNMGISARSYPNENIKDLTRLRASVIYERDYWQRMGCDQINSQLVAGVILDAAVNHGQKRAAKLVQQVVGVGIDGYIGEITLRAINDYPSPIQLAAVLTLARIRHYATLAAKRKSQRKYLLGWIDRALNVAAATN